MNMLPLPVFLFYLFTVGTLLAYAFRRWERGSALAAGIFCAGLGYWMAASLSAERGTISLLSAAVNVSGRSEQFSFVFHLRPDNLPLVMIGLGLASVALLLGGVVRQSQSFAPLVLLISFGYVYLSLLVEAPLPSPLLAPLILVLLTALGVFLLQGGQVGRIGGPLRSLLPPLLAFPFFLLGSWYLEQIQLNPQSNDLLAMTGWLLSLGILLLLAPVPLHAGQAVTAQSAPPLVTALLTLLYQLAVISLLFQIDARYAFVANQTPLLFWLTVGGVVTALWGGLAAAGTTHPGRLWGYALLHDWGLILLVLAVPGPERWSLVLFLFLLRAVSTFTAAVGLAQLSNTVGSLEPQWLEGTGSRLPWNSTAFLLGSLGLAGFPLSAGFAGHWAALQIVAETDWRIAAVVLVASGGVVFGFVRLVRILFGPLSNGLLPRESILASGVAAGMIVLTASMAIAPQLLRDPIVWALSAFSG